MLERDEHSRHVVIVTDGPDTCSATDDVESCPAHLPFDALETELDSGSTVVPITFLHFESSGYRGPSADMLRIAGRTGGHYLFIASQAMGSGERRQTFADHVVVLRTALGGHWQLEVDLGSPSLDPAEIVRELSGRLDLVEGPLATLDSFDDFRVPLLVE